ncbi:hypothetical protein WOLCODRAFT_104009, partial [Wolfiporia cocos MD-104 SS10]
ESKLKALKVVDLKHILARAAVPVPSKSTKPDLIARVLASPAARAVYDAQFGAAKDTQPDPPRSKNDPAPADDLLAPPEDLDWSPDADPTQGAPPASAPSSSVKATPASPSPPLSKPASTAASVAPSAPEASPALPAEDDELARRKARAARFGIALVEPKPGPVPKGKTPKPADKTGGAAGAKAAKGPSALTDDPEKLAARAARFGIAPPSAADASKSIPTSGKKRAAPPVDAVDAEELERRKKR